jgi:hypothetical protein
MQQFKEAIQHFGNLEFFDYEPEVLREELPKHLDADKIQACIILLTTKLYQTTYEGFENISNALLGKIIYPDTMTPLSIEEICSSLKVASKIDEDLKLNNEVQTYIITVLKLGGMSYVPSCIKKFITKKYNIEVHKKAKKINDEFDKELSTLWDS